MSFASDIEKFARRTNLSMDIIVRKVGIDIARSLILRSPVDTGRFRGNWVLGVGSVNTAVNPDITDQEGGKFTGFQSNKTNDTLNKIAEGINAVRAGGVFYISNSLPYAIPLEYGHSMQAPGGMVRLTVREFKSYIENAVRNMK
jgi:hypothetical protein